jgi:hypothetical protein
MVWDDTLDILRDTDETLGSIYNTQRTSYP